VRFIIILLNHFKNHSNMTSTPASKYCMYGPYHYSCLEMILHLESLEIYLGALNHYIIKY